MTKREELVNTSFGAASIKVVACDGCGTTVLQSEVYYCEPGWFKIENCKTGNDGSTTPRTKEEHDFCSKDCLIRHLAPGIYDTNPHVVAQAIKDLQKMERDLGTPAA